MSGYFNRNTSNSKDSEARKQELRNQALLTAQARSSTSNADSGTSGVASSGDRYIPSGAISNVGSNYAASGVNSIANSGSSAAVSGGSAIHPPGSTAERILTTYNAVSNVAETVGRTVSNTVQGVGDAVTEISAVAKKVHDHATGVNVVNTNTRGSSNTNRRGQGSRSRSPEIAIGGGAVEAKPASSIQKHDSLVQHFEISDDSDASRSNKDSKTSSTGKKGKDQAKKTSSSTVTSNFRLQPAGTPNSNALAAGKTGFSDSNNVSNFQRTPNSTDILNRLLEADSPRGVKNGLQSSPDDSNDSSLYDNLFDGGIGGGDRDNSIVGTEFPGPTGSRELQMSPSQKQNEELIAQRRKEKKSLSVASKKSGGSGSSSPSSGKKNKVSTGILHGYNPINEGNQDGAAGNPAAGNTNSGATTGQPALGTASNPITASKTSSDGAPAAKSSNSKTKSNSKRSLASQSHSPIVNDGSEYPYGGYPGGYYLPDYGQDPTFVRDRDPKEYIREREYNKFSKQYDVDLGPIGSGYTGGNANYGTGQGIETRGSKEGNTGETTDYLEGIKNPNFEDANIYDPESGNLMPGETKNSFDDTDPAASKLTGQSGGGLLGTSPARSPRSDTMHSIEEEAIYIVEEPEVSPAMSPVASPHIDDSTVRGLDFNKQINFQTHNATNLEDVNEGRAGKDGSKESTGRDRTRDRERKSGDRDKDRDRDRKSKDRDRDRDRERERRRNKTSGEKPSPNPSSGGSISSFNSSGNSPSRRKASPDDLKTSNTIGTIDIIGGENTGSLGIKPHRAVPAGANKDINVEKGGGIRASTAPGSGSLNMGSQIGNVGFTDVNFGIPVGGSSPSDVETLNTGLGSGGSKKANATSHVKKDSTRFAGPTSMDPQTKKLTPNDAANAPTNTMVQQFNYISSAEDDRPGFNFSRPPNAGGVGGVGNQGAPIAPLLSQEEINKGRDLNQQQQQQYDNYGNMIQNQYTGGVNNNFNDMNMITQNRGIAGGQLQMSDDDFSDLGVVEDILESEPVPLEDLLTNNSKGSMGSGMNSNNMRGYGGQNYGVYGGGNSKGSNIESIQSKKTDPEVAIASKKTIEGTVISQRDVHSSHAGGTQAAASLRGENAGTLPSSAGKYYRDNLENYQNNLNYAAQAQPAAQPDSAQKMSEEKKEKMTASEEYISRLLNEPESAGPKFNDTNITNLKQNQLGSTSKQSQNSNNLKLDRRGSERPDNRQGKPSKEGIHTGLDSGENSEDGDQGPESATIRKLLNLEGESPGSAEIEEKLGGSRAGSGKPSSGSGKQKVVDKNVSGSGAISISQSGPSSSAASGINIGRREAQPVAGANPNQEQSGLQNSNDNLTAASQGGQEIEPSSIYDLKSPPLNMSTENQNLPPVNPESPGDGGDFDLDFYLPKEERKEPETTTADNQDTAAGKRVSLTGDVGARGGDIQHLHMAGEEEQNMMQNTNIVDPGLHQQQELVNDESDLAIPRQPRNQNRNSASNADPTASIASDSKTSTTQLKKRISQGDIVSGDPNVLTPYQLSSFQELVPTNQTNSILDAVISAGLVLGENSAPGGSEQTGLAPGPGGYQVLTDLGAIENIEPPSPLDVRNTGDETPLGYGGDPAYREMGQNPYSEPGMYTVTAERNLKGESPLQPLGSPIQGQLPDAIVNSDDPASRILGEVVAASGMGGQQVQIRPAASPPPEMVDGAGLQIRDAAANFSSPPEGMNDYGGYEIEESPESMPSPGLGFGMGLGLSSPAQPAGTMQPPTLGNEENDEGEDKFQEDVVEETLLNKQISEDDSGFGIMKKESSAEGFSIGKKESSLDGGFAIGKKESSYSTGSGALSLGAGAGTGSGQPRGIYGGKIEEEDKDDFDGGKDDDYSNYSEDMFEEANDDELQREKEREEAQRKAAAVEKAKQDAENMLKMLRMEEEEKEKAAAESERIEKEKKAAELEEMDRKLREIEEKEREMAEREKQLQEEEERQRREEEEAQATRDRELERLRVEREREEQEENRRQEEKLERLRIEREREEEGQQNFREAPNVMGMEDTQGAPYNFNDDPYKTMGIPADSALTMPGPPRKSLEELHEGDYQEHDMTDHPLPILNVKHPSRERFSELYGEDATQQYDDAKQPPVARLLSQDRLKYRRKDTNFEKGIEYGLEEDEEEGAAQYVRVKSPATRRQPQDDESSTSSVELSNIRPDVAPVSGQDSAVYRRPASQRRSSQDSLKKNITQAMGEDDDLTIKDNLGNNVNIKDIPSNAIRRSAGGTIRAFLKDDTKGTSSGNEYAIPISEEQYEKAKRNREIGERERRERELNDPMRRAKDVGMDIDGYSPRRDGIPAVNSPRTDPRDLRNDDERRADEVAYVEEIARRKYAAEREKERELYRQAAETYASLTAGEDREEKIKREFERRKRKEAKERVDRSVERERSRLEEKAGRKMERSRQQGNMGDVSMLTEESSPGGAKLGGRGRSPPYQDQRKTSEREYAAKLRGGAFTLRLLPERDVQKFQRALQTVLSDSAVSPHDSLKILDGCRKAHVTGTQDSAYFAESDSEDEAAAPDSEVSEGEIKTKNREQVRRDRKLAAQGDSSVFRLAKAAAVQYLAASIVNNDVSPRICLQLELFLRNSLIEPKGCLMLVQELINNDGDQNFNSAGSPRRGQIMPLNSFRTPATQAWPRVLEATLRGKPNLKLPPKIKREAMKIRRWYPIFAENLSAMEDKLRLKGSKQDAMDLEINTIPRVTSCLLQPFEQLGLPPSFQPIRRVLRTGEALRSFADQVNTAYNTWIEPQTGDVMMLDTDGNNGNGNFLGNDVHSNTLALGDLPTRDWRDPSAPFACAFSVMYLSGTLNIYPKVRGKASPFNQKITAPIDPNRVTETGGGSLLCGGTNYIAQYDVEKRVCIDQICIYEDVEDAVQLGGTAGNPNGKTPGGGSYGNYFDKRQSQGSNAGVLMTTEGIHMKIPKHKKEKYMSNQKGGNTGNADDMYDDENIEDDSSDSSSSLSSIYSDDVEFQSENTVSQAGSPELNGKNNKNNFRYYNDGNTGDIQYSSPGDDSNPNNATSENGVSPILDLPCVKNGLLTVGGSSGSAAVLTGQAADDLKKKKQKKKQEREENERRKEKSKKDKTTVSGKHSKGAVMTYYPEPANNIPNLPSGYNGNTGDNGGNAGQSFPIDYAVVSMASNKTNDRVTAAVTAYDGSGSGFISLWKDSSDVAAGEDGIWQLERGIPPVNLHQNLDEEGPNYFGYLHVSRLCYVGDAVVAGCTTTENTGISVLEDSLSSGNKQRAGVLHRYPTFSQVSDICSLSGNRGSTTGGSNIDSTNDDPFLFCAVTRYPSAAVQLFDLRVREKPVQYYSLSHTDLTAVCCVGGRNNLAPLGSPNNITNLDPYATPFSILAAGSAIFRFDGRAIDRGPLAALELPGTAIKLAPSRMDNFVSVVDTTGLYSLNIYELDDKDVKKWRKLVLRNREENMKKYEKEFTVKGGVVGPNKGGNKDTTPTARGGKQVGKNQDKRGRNNKLYYNDAESDQQQNVGSSQRRSSLRKSTESIDKSVSFRAIEQSPISPSVGSGGSPDTTLFYNDVTRIEGNHNAMNNISSSTDQNQTVLGLVGALGESNDATILNGINSGIPFLPPPAKFSEPQYAEESISFRRGLYYDVCGCDDALFACNEHGISYYRCKWNG